MPEPQWTIVRTLRIDEHMDKALKREAKSERLTVSDIMRRAILEHIERQKELA